MEVMSWFSANGFESIEEGFPEKPGEKALKTHSLDAILDSLEREDGKYEVGPYRYIFPSAFKGPRILYPGIGSGGVNIDESALVHFRKILALPELETLPPTIKEKQETTSTAVGEIMNK
jgi:hypothetical protein